MPGIQWTVGDVEIHQLIELEAGELIQAIITDASPENIQPIKWLVPYFADEDGHLKALVQAFLVKSDGRNILIDSCVGNDKKRPEVAEWDGLRTDFLDNLTHIGLTPQDIDVVICTHLHMDHVGWNTRLEDNRWVPTFPAARHLFARTEYEYWSGEPEKEIADDRAAFADSVGPIVDAGLADFVELDHRLDRHVTLIPTNGHTPGHVSVMIESNGRSAIITGDLLHHPCQIAHPGWITDSDTYPNEAVESRERIFKRMADSNTLMIGSHFADPVAGRIVRTPDGYVFTVHPER